MAPDKHVEAIREELLQRSKRGLEKYGTTTERGDLTRKQWLQHGKEEALDLAVYLQVLISEEEANEKPHTGPATD